jgi:acylphosphatase
MMAIRFIVTGRVQGVGYRYFVMREADALGITGFARNLPDGSVEVVSEGSEGALEIFAGRLAQGPAFATVESVERSEAPSPKTGSFSIR